MQIFFHLSLSYLIKIKPIKVPILLKFDVVGTSSKVSCHIITEAIGNVLCEFSIRLRTAFNQIDFDNVTNLLSLKSFFFQKQALFIFLISLIQRWYSSLLFPKMKGITHFQNWKFLVFSGLNEPHILYSIGFNFLQQNKLCHHQIKISVFTNLNLFLLIYICGEYLQSLASS